MDNTKDTWPGRPERSAVLIDFDLAIEKPDNALARWQVVRNLVAFVLCAKHNEKYFMIDLGYDPVHGYRIVAK